MRSFLLALVAVVAVSACKSEPLEPITCPYYWAAEKDGKVTHMLGTIHGSVASSQLPKYVWDDQAAASTVVVEADIEDTSIVEKLKRESPTLKEELGDVYWGKLKGYVGGQMANALDKMKPFVAITVIMQKALPRQLPSAIDADILKAARKKKKRVEFFETLDEQLAILEKHLSIRELEMMLDDTKGLEDEMKKLVAAYMRGDEAAMLATMEEQWALSLKYGYSQAEIDAMREDTLYKRNAAWIPQIEKLHANGGAFIAVGAAHLIGGRSVIDLLTKQGYDVRRAACTPAPGKTP